MHPIELCLIVSTGHLVEPSKSELLGYHAQYAVEALGESLTLS